jgi:hypothetical protein
MMNWHFNAWLRAACALFCGAGILLLTACGGGNGAPNNPYTPPPTPVPPLQILPATSNAYQGTPITLTVYGGVPPYRAFSSDQTILPVSQAVSGDTIVLAANNVTAATSISVTVQDASGAVSPSAAVVVNPAPLFSGSVVVTGNFNPDCPDTANAVCSGSTGTAAVKVLGNGGVGLASRPLRFDVIQGNFSIVSTNPGQPLVQTLTVVSDNQGNANVVLAVPADTPTQIGLLRVTDVTSGNQITASFNILQMTVGGEVLSVLPRGNTTITGPDTLHCSSGVVLNYYIYGGKPPYTVQTNFPQYMTLGGTPVTKSGGQFTATTTGGCFVNGTFVITDQTGRTIPTGNYPTVSNNLGTTAPVPPQTPLVVTPGAIAKNNCVPANTFQFIGTGGTTPYSVVVTSSTSSTTPTVAPQTGVAQGAAVTVANLTSPSSTTVTLFDNSSPRQSGTVTIDCSGQPNTPAPSALVITPQSYDFSQSSQTTTGSCVNQTANFTVTGGTPPYTVFFAPLRPGAIITPPTLQSSGQGFSVTNLTDGVVTTNITVQDSGTPQLQKIATIQCPAIPGGSALSVVPGTYTYVGAAACANSASTFSINGGVPPFTVFFSTAGTQGTISPSTVPSIVPPANQFTVSGLDASGLPRITSLTVQDSAGPSKVRTVNIDCRP